MMTADAAGYVEALCKMPDEEVSTIISSVLQARPELAPCIVNFAVPDLTYAPARALTERRSTGVIKGRNPGLGCGFITCPEMYAVFNCDVMVEAKQMGSFQQGQEVSFAVVLSKDLKPLAFDLEVVGASAVMPSAAGGLGGGVHQLGTLGGLGSPGMAGGLAGPGSLAQPPPPPAAAGTGLGSLGVAGLAGVGKPAGGAAAAQPVPKRPLDANSQVLGEFTGTIASFNTSIGFGFISCDEVKSQGYQNDVFLHGSHLGGFEVGSRVKFTCYLNPKGQPQGRDLQAA